VPRGTPFVTVNGAPATLEPDGVTFTAPLALAEGGNEIRAQAFPFGQEDSVRVTLDTVPPALELLFPEDGTLTGDAEVAFAGFVSEAGRVEAVGPGGAAAAATQTRVLAPGNELFGIQPILEFVFELPLLALVDGPNPIDLRLVDRAGNESLVPLTLRRSSAALVLESPAAGSALPDLRTDLVLRVLEDVTLEALFSAGRRVPGFAGIALSAGALPPATATLSGVPLAPGTTELRLVYRRDATGEREVLSFALESLATEVATVAGIVTDSQTGNPLEGALVTVVVNGLELVVPSGPDGRFALPVEPGDVQVVVRREGFVDLVVDGMPGAGETFVADANLIPWSVQSRPIPTDPSPGTTSTVAGTVTDLATGDPLEGALVLITQDGVQLSAITEASGDYAIGEIPVGGFEVTITRVGFFPQVFTISTREPVEVPLDVALEAIPETVTLVGTLIDRDTGEPLPFVPVDVLGTELVVVTDEEGAFVLEDVPLGQQTLRFRRTGFLDEFSIVTFEPQPGGNPIQQTFVLSFVAGPVATRAIPPDATGTVIDRFTLEPLADVEVEARSLVTGQVVASVVSDSEGSFVFANLESGDTIEFTATGPDHEPQAIQAFVVPNGDEILDFRLRRTAEGQVAGTVMDAVTGEPVTLAEVRLLDGSLATASDGDGSYELLGVPPGTRDLEVVHPRYFPAPATLSVAPDETVPLSVSLDPRPTSGSLSGRVLDAATGEPVPGAQLSGPSGAAATADAEGRYTLAHVPAGLVDISIEAQGFPTQTRTAVVDADLSAAEPTTREVDFQLTGDGSLTVEASATVPVTGGTVELPDGSFRLDLPPLALSGDAVVTLRRVERPDVAPGQSVPLESKLGAPPVFALGGGVEIQVESATPGETAPVFVGPVVVSARYSAQVAEGVGIDEEGLLPAYFDEDRGVWTLIRLIPFLHAVDRINRRMVAGLSVILTEAGDPITARLQTPDPVHVAGFADLPVIRNVRKLTLAVVGALKDLVLVNKTGRLIFFDFDEDFPQIEDARREWSLNSRPLLVFHGWSPRTFVFNSNPMDKEDIFNPQESRYGDILEDLVEGTDGVYRPVFATYNSRMGLESIGNVIKREVRANRDALSGEENPEDPSQRGEFSSFDAFGFSMGGLAERGYQQAHEPGRSIRSMVSMGTPHHGALQLLRLALDGVIGALTGLPGIGAFELFVATWSPGTADLLDYSDSVCNRGGGFETVSGNPTLCRMNRDVSTAPDTRMSLIAGDRSGSLSELYDRFEENVDDERFKEGVQRFRDVILDPEFRGVDLNPLDELASEGFLGTGCIRSDGVVCVWSAHARSGPRGGRVAALSEARVEQSVRDFDHANAGRVDPDPARNQPIAGFRDQDILPNLTDWAVTKVLDPLQFTPPTEDEAGQTSIRVAIEFNAPNGDITGNVLVLYGGFRNEEDELEWKILVGADEEGNPDTRASASTFARVEGNSVAQEDIVLSALFPINKVNPADPTTKIEVVQSLVVDLGRSRQTVPLRPDVEDAFFLPNPTP